MWQTNKEKLSLAEDQLREEKNKMDVITIKATKEQREELKKIVKALGYETMSEWLRAFIRDNKSKVS